MTAVSLVKQSASPGDYWELLKPRVMSLVVFTGLCGMIMAPGHINPVLGFAAILSIAIGAGASGCLNMWWERDVDALMKRTHNRPIPAGKIEPDDALAFGVILSAGSVLVMTVAINWLAAALLAFTIFFYVFIYTMILKRLTSYNIVIGGVAGALPPVIGWASVTGNVPIEAWVLFLIIFLWTPPHFWALSLNCNDDYVKAKIPMLPLVKGVKKTKEQILLYAVVLFLSSLIPYFIGMATLLYLAVSIVLGIGFIGLSLGLLLGKDIGMKVFGYSIAYLFILFLTLTIDRVLCL